MACRVLVVGGGSIGERHVRCFQRTGRADVSLCEINDDVRGRVGETYQLPQTFAGFSDALAADPELVVICTPAHLHVPMGIVAAEAGCHLMIEKPLSTSMDRVEELMELVRTRQRVASVAYVSRAHPALQEVKEALDSGEFGRPLEVVAQSGQHFPLYRPAYREIYYTDRATGGGAIQDALTHMLNSVEWLVGPMTEVAADAAHLRLEGVSVEDTVHAIARHGAIMASYSLNQHQAPNESRLTIVCENGTVRVEMHENRWLASTEPGEPLVERSAFALERDDLFVRQAERMLDAVAGSAPVACPLEDALQTLRVNLAILDAADRRWWRVVAVDSRQLSVVGERANCTAR